MNIPGIFHQLWSFDNSREKQGTWLHPRLLSVKIDKCSIHVFVIYNAISGIRPLKYGCLWILWRVRLPYACDKIITTKLWEVARLLLLGSFSLICVHQIQIFFFWNKKSATFFAALYETCLFFGFEPCWRPLLTPTFLIRNLNHHKEP